MSHGRGPPAGVVQTKRRTWDDESYRKKAEERAALEAGSAKPSDEFLPPSERAALTARETFYDFNSRVGKVTAVNDKDRSSGGFYCDVCDVLLRDSLSFTSHVNGRKHLRKLGISEYTQRSSLEDVLTVLEAGRRKRFPDRYVAERLFESTRMASRLASSSAQGTVAKSSNGEAHNDASNAKQQHNETSSSAKKENADSNEMNVDPEDAEMQEMLGFTGFGSTKGKKK